MAEVTFTGYNFASKDTTPGACQDYPFAWRDPNTNREIRAWYCVRPRTIDYPSIFDEFNVTRYETDTFGWAFTYGEGQFYKKTLYSSSGTCGMKFYTGPESDNFQELEDDSITDDVGQPYFRCFQLGTIVGANGQQVDFNITTVDLSNLSFTNTTFIEFSGFDLTQLPNQDTTSTSTPTTSTPVATDTTAMSSTESMDSDEGFLHMPNKFIIYQSLILIFVLTRC